MITLEEIKKSSWYKSRPNCVKERILQYPPTHKYFLKSADQIVTLYSFAESENGKCDTCTVLVLTEHNPNILFERKVFGIKFEDLEMMEELK